MPDLIVVDRGGDRSLADRGNIALRATFGSGGVPAGGTTNQVLTKASGTDFDSYWANPVTGRFNYTNAALIDPNGNDSTGTVGDLNKPFKTVQAAATAFEATSPDDNNCIFLINGLFSENVTTSLQSLTFVGGGTFGSQAFSSLTLTDPVNPLTVTGVNCVLNSISANTANTLRVDVSGGGLVQGNLQNSGGDVSVNGSGPSVNAFSINITSAGNAEVGNLWGWATELDIIAAGDVSSYNCLLNNVTAGGNVEMNDSRFAPGGTLHVTGTTTYFDSILANPIFPSANPHIAGAGYWVGSVFTKSSG